VRTEACADPLAGQRYHRTGTDWAGLPGGWAAMQTG
jgi:hypothetical protein